MIEGFEVPLHRSLTEPILLGGAPRAIAIVNGTIAAALGLGLQLWLAGLLLWVRRPLARRVRRQARSGLRRQSCRRHLRQQGVSRMLNLAEYRQQVRPARRSSALGGAGRARRRAQQGWQLPAQLALSRSRSGERDRGRTGRRLRARQQCAAPASARAGRCSSRPSAIRRRAIPHSDFPDPASWLVDEERRAQFEDGVSLGRDGNQTFAREHFENAYILTLLYLPPPDRVARAERALIETEGGEQKRDWRQELDALRRGDRPRSRSPRPGHAGDRATRRWRDADLSAPHDFDQAPYRSRSRTRRSISMRILADHP